MIDKQELVLASSFIVANAAIVSLTGDWFVFKGTSQILDIGGTSVECKVYGGEAYNLFGSICSSNISDLEDIITTLQVLVSINLAFALLLFFLVAFRRMKKNLIKVTCLVILGLTISSASLWVSHDFKVLPTESDKINCFGAGWIMAIVCATATLPMFTI